MPELQRLYVRVLGDIQDLDKKMSEAERLTMRFGDRLRSVGRGITIGVTTPLVGLGTVATTAAVELDRLRRGLEVSAGSAEAASRQLRELERIARMPGLGFREAIQGAVQLNTVLEGMPDRLSLSNRLLEQFGNALALTGGGRAELDRVIMQLGQMAAAGRVLTADLRPIIQTAPAVATALRQAFGTIDATEIEALGLSSQEFFERLLQGLESLPRAARGPAQAFEDFTDSLFRARAAIGEAMLPAVTELTSGLADMLEEIEALDPALLRIGIGMGAALAVAGPLTIGLGALTTTITALTAAGVSLTAAIAGPAALIGGLSLLAGWWVKNKLDAAAFRGELERLRDTARQVSGDLTPEQLSAIARGRRETLVAYQQRRAELIAEQRARLGGTGLGAGALLSEADIIRSMSGAIKEEFQNVERVIASTQGALAGLFASFQGLKDATGDTGDNVESIGIILPDVAGLFSYLVDRERELAQEADRLRIDAALAAGTEEAERLNERLATTLTRLDRVREALSQFPADASVLSPQTAIGTSIGAPLRALGAAPVSPMLTDWAQAAMHRMMALGIDLDTLRELDPNLAEAIVAELRKEARVRRSWAQAAEAPGGLGWGDVGAAFVGLGGIAGGRAGGFLGGIGGAITSIVSAANPVTAALGAFGGAIGALTSILDSGVARTERMRQAFDRLLRFLDTKFSLLDVPVIEQFEELRRTVLEQMTGGPLRRLLAESGIEDIQDFINATVREIERIDAIRDPIERMRESMALMLQFGGLSRDQILDLLQKFKALAAETNQAVNEALFNVPQGFKIALERFRATTPTPLALGGTTGPGGSSTTPPVVARGGDTYIFELRDVGQRDVRELVDDIFREVRRRKSRGGWTEMDLAFAT